MRATGFLLLTLASTAAGQTTISPTAAYGYAANAGLTTAPRRFFRAVAVALPIAPRAGFSPLFPSFFKHSKPRTG